MRSKKALVAVLVVAAAAIGIALGSMAFSNGGTSAAMGRQAAQGIKVHGKWTIDVRSHGRLVSRARFENSLVGTHPANFLAEILGRTATPGLWEISVIYLGAGGAPCNPDAGAVHPRECMLVEPAQTGTGASAPANVGSFKVLTVTPPTDMFEDKPLKLSGAFTATADGKIGIVQTSLWRCPGNIAPSSPCQSGYIPPMTSKDLTDPGGPGVVTITSGQQVLITVNISFS